MDSNNITDDLPIYAYASCKSMEVIHHAVKDLWVKVYAARVENYIEPLVLLEDVKSMIDKKVIPLTSIQIEQCFQEAAGADENTHIRFARAIEREHGIY